MAYLEVSAFKKLRAFFWALQKSGFNLNKLPAKDNEGMPVDKVYCLNLLHSFPDFQGEQFKDDNTIVKYLSQPGNIKQILDQFTPEQQIELTKVFEEKPVTVEVVSEQPSGQEASAEQGVPAQATGGEPAGTMTGGMSFPGIAGRATAASTPRRIIRNIPRAPEPTPGTTTASGASAKVTMTTPAVGSTTTTSSGLSGNMTFNLSPKAAETAETTQSAKGIKGAGRRFQFPKIPAGFVNNLKTFGSALGRFLQGPLSRLALPGFMAGIGAFVGASFGGLGALAGAVGFGSLPSLFKSGAMGNFARKVGSGAVNFFPSLSREAMRSRLSSIGKKGAWRFAVLLFIGMFGLSLLTAFTGAGTPGGGTSTGGNVGIGSTAPSVSIASPSPLQPGVRPVAPSVDPARLKDSLISQFGITMNGFDIQHLQWAWEKFWDVSNTNFIRFVRGSVINTTSTRASYQVGCPGSSVAVYLGQYSEVLFKYALTHELGHVLRNCPNSLNNYYAEHYNAYTRERGVTYYGNNAASCTGSDNVSEDYAEMIAVYLNPSANIQIARCAPPGSPYPNLRTDFPLHYNVARSILGDY